VKGPGFLSYIGFVIRVTVPDPWEAEHPGLPEMSSTEDGVFRARRTLVEDPWVLEIQWRAGAQSYLCRVGRGSVEDFADSRELVYPHEVMAWMTTWFSLIKKIETLLEVEEGSLASKKTPV
jgi:hypothetical protein